MLRNTFFKNRVCFETLLKYSENNKNLNVFGTILKFFQKIFQNTMGHLSKVLKLVWEHLRTLLKCSGMLLKCSGTLFLKCSGILLKNITELLNTFENISKHFWNVREHFLKLFPNTFWLFQCTFEMFRNTFLNCSWPLLKMFLNTFENVPEHF